MLRGSILLIPKVDDYHRFHHIHHLGTLLVCASLILVWPTHSRQYERFFFPDSPTTAWFLTDDERAAAVCRIQKNQTGVENKHFKTEQ